MHLIITCEFVSVFSVFLSVLGSNVANIWKKSRCSNISEGLPL